MVEDVTQWLAVIGTVVTGVMGYGKLQQQVANHDEQLEKTVTKESLIPFQEEILRRLERIERNQDTKSN